tara:strand:- start:4893 stop:5201 length:309 start_codon:yes stop_codon:yes gene_type:complete
MYKFKVPVPSRPPKEPAYIDTTGRSWALPSDDEQNDDYFTEWSGNFWYVWFQGAELECPEEDEIIYADGFEAKVVHVNRLYRTMRAVVELEVYKDKKYNKNV